MTQLTLRGFDASVEKAIRALAKREGISLSQAALTLVKRGAGLARSKVNPNAIGSSYDDLIGTWSKKEADAFDRATRSLNVIDEAMWK
jgi:hypothetical protein